MTSQEKTKLMEWAEWGSKLIITSTFGLIYIIYNQQQDILRKVDKIESAQAGTVSDVNYIKVNYVTKEYLELVLEIERSKAKRDKGATK